MIDVTSIPQDDGDGGYTSTIVKDEEEAVVETTRTPPEFDPFNKPAEFGENDV